MNKLADLNLRCWGGGGKECIGYIKKNNFRWHNNIHILRAVPSRSALNFTVSVIPMTLSQLFIDHDTGHIEDLIFALY